MSAKLGMSEDRAVSLGLGPGAQPAATRSASRYTAFISYRHTEYSRAQAESLESALRLYAKPLWRPPISIFRDDRILRPGDDLPRTIRKALVDSEFLLYLATKSAAESEWVQDELRIWCAELNRADRLVIILASDSIEVDVSRGAVNWEQTDAIPPILKPFVSSIPVWVDLSWANTDAQRDLLNVDYRRAINAITARFRHIEPGEMNDQEVITHRRNMRLRNGFIAVIVASMLTAVYFGDQARRDRMLAEAAAQSERIAANSEKEQRQRAENAAKSEREQRQRAENAARSEREQRQRAENAARSEQEQRQHAENAARSEREQRQRAENEQRRAEEQRALAEKRARQVEMGEAYRLVTHGNDNLRLGDVKRAQTQFTESARLFERLELDPLMALHGRFAAEARQLAIEHIVKVAGEVSFLRVSGDGDLLAVVYDYQSPGGDPDLDRIQDWPAAGVYSISKEKWLITHQISSAIGAKLYKLRPASVIGFQSPDALIVDIGEKGDGDALVLMSMSDGTQRACDEGCRRGLQPRSALLDREAPASLAPLLQPQQLFRRSPADGIDEYSPRLVDEVKAKSPNGRTALVGTYEGRLLRLDLGAGLVQGETQLGPIFDIAYQRDSRAAFVADRSAIVRVDTSAWPRILELSAPLRPFTGEAPYENVLEAEIADDGQLAVVTTERLLLLDRGRDKWASWKFPKRLSAVAALAIDVVRHRAVIVNADDGGLFVFNLSRENELVEAPSISGGKEAVAAISADASTVWGTAARPTSLVATITKRTIDNHPATYTTVSVPLQESKRLASDLPAVHAISQLEDRLLLFYGDARGWDENTVDHERLVSVRASDAAQPQDRVVFEANDTMTGVGNFSTVTQVERVLQGSSPGRMLVSVGGRSSILVIAGNGVTPTPGTLMFRERNDRDQVYGISVEHGEETKENKSVAPVRVVIDHQSSGARVAYELPWSAANQSQVLAAVDRKGEQIAVVGNMGHIVLCNVNAIPR